MKTTIICPNCHESINIEVNATAAAANKRRPSVVNARPVGAKARLLALKNMGVDVSKFVAMTDGVSLARVNASGVLERVPQDDPMMQIVVDGGNLNVPRLWKRFIMAQVTDGLLYDGYYGKGFDAWLRAKGYNYQWTMLHEELKRQVRMKREDPENYEIHHGFFAPWVVIESIYHYIDVLEEHINGLRIRKYKGQPYRTVAGEHVLLSNMDARFFRPATDAIAKLHRADTPEAVLAAFEKFKRVIVKLPHNTNMCKKWVNAYKGVGGFFTMQNLVMFHGCHLYTSGNGYRCHHFDQQEIMEKVRKYAISHLREGYKVFGMMKTMLEDNGINLADKRDEWRRQWKINHNG